MLCCTCLVWIYSKTFFFISKLTIGLVWLISSLYLEKVVILTIFFCMIFFFLVRYVFGFMVLQNIGYDTEWLFLNFISIFFYLHGGGEHNPLLFCEPLLSFVPPMTGIVSYITFLSIKMQH